MSKTKYKELKHVDPESEDYKKAVEELVDIVRTQPDTRTYVLDDDIQNFIEDIHITSGRCTIPAYIIYYEYMLWEGVTSEGARPKYSYEQFFKRFGAKFPRKKTNVGSTYRLNTEVFGKYLEMPADKLKEIKDSCLNFRDKVTGNLNVIEKKVAQHGSKKEKKEDEVFQEKETFSEEE